MKKKSVSIFLTILCGVFLVCNESQAVAISSGERAQVLLSGAGWQFTGASSNSTMPEVDSDGFAAAPWQTVSVPHVFQTRAHFDEIMQAWYRRDFNVPPDFSGKRLYLVFEVAATTSDEPRDG